MLSTPSVRFQRLETLQSLTRSLTRCLCRQSKPTDKKKRSAHSVDPLRTRVRPVNLQVLVKKPPPSSVMNQNKDYLHRNSNRCRSSRALKSLLPPFLLMISSELELWIRAQTTNLQFNPTYIINISSTSTKHREQSTWVSCCENII